MSANGVGSKGTEARSAIDRLALIGITAVGMAFCAGGIGRVAASGDWLSVPGVVGTLLGVGILGVVGARLLGRDLPLVASDRQAIVVVLAVAAVKFVIAATTL